MHSLYQETNKHTGIILYVLHVSLAEDTRDNAVFFFLPNGILHELAF
jgi:hypothetical protein